MVALPSLAFLSLSSGDMVILWLGGKVRVGSVFYHFFCFVLVVLTAYLFCIGLYRMHVLADSRQ